MATTKSARTRQRILDAAARVFASGYSGASITAIAAEAGLQAGSIYYYYYFDSVDDLMVAVMEVGSMKGRAELERALDCAGAEASALDRFRAAVRAHLVAAMRDGDYTRANVRMINQVPEHLHARHLPEALAYAKLWRALFDELAGNGSLRPDLHLSAARMLLFGAMNWAVEWYRPGGGLTPEDIADQVSAIVLDGILAT